jgi:hypothetical protein
MITDVLIRAVVADHLEGLYGLQVAADVQRKGIDHAVVKHHLHHWRSLDVVTGAVIAAGTAPTLIMRRPLRASPRRVAENQ